MTDTFHVAGEFAVAPALPEIPEIRKVAFDAPYAWIAGGWRDLWIAPQISLAYGAVFAAFAYVAVLQLTRFNALPLLLPLTFGFLLVGPILAAGLYQISRLNERGEAITYRTIALAVWSERDQLASFGMLLFVLYFFWMDVAFLLFMLFFGPASFPPIDEFISALSLTGPGNGLLMTGTAVGVVFAAVTYSISVIAVPMIFDRKMDAVTAMIASVRAVRKNLPAMALWAVLIAALSVAGLTVYFVGLAITFPLIGHASWHAYKELAQT
ncbi:MAG: DUF2189 domain-containing protein [Rhodomicrobium sp.]